MWKYTDTQRGRQTGKVIQAVDRFQESTAGALGIAGMKCLWAERKHLRYVLSPCQQYQDNGCCMFDTATMHLRICFLFEIFFLCKEHQTEDPFPHTLHGSLAWL